MERRRVKQSNLHRMCASYKPNMTWHRSHMNYRRTQVPEQWPEEVFCGIADSLRKEKSPTESPVEAEAHFRYLGREKNGHRPTGVGMVTRPFLFCP